MKKILSCLCMLIAVIACNKKDTNQAQNKPIVKIGVVAPLTGNMAMVGEGIKSAVILAEEDLAKRNLKNNYEFIVEDDAYEARKTAMIYPKLKSLDKVDAILSTFSQTGKIIAPHAQADKILHISLSSDAEIARGKYNFLDWTTPKNTAKRMLEFYKKHNIRKIVSFVPNNAGALPQETAFMDLVKDDGEIKVSRHLIAAEERDFRTLFVKSAQEKPDAYLALIYGSSFIPFFKQYREAGETALITSIETFAALSDTSIAEGAYYTDAAVADDEFLKRHQQRFGEISNYGVGTMYDTIMLTVEAFEKAENKTQAADELAKIKHYNGVVGKLEQEEEGIFNSPAILMTIKNGKRVKVEE